MVINRIRSNLLARLLYRPPIIHLDSTCTHSFAALIVCASALLGAQQLQSVALKSLHKVQTSLQSVLRHSADALVEQASQQAKRQGLAMRAVSVAHNAATPSAWGRVALEVSTTGPYAASKAWQASLQQAHPALAVQSVRWQAASAPGAGLDAQWTRVAACARLIGRCA